MPCITRSPRLRRPLHAATIGIAITLLAGCATDTKDPPRAQNRSGAITGLLAQTGQGTCLNLTRDTIGAVAAHIYQEVASGPVVREAARRASHSASLLRAVASDDPLATHRALDQLSKGQIVRAQILRGSRVLAEIGGSPAVAPIREPLRSPTGETIGTLVISTHGTRAFIDTLRSLTGARVTLSGASQTAVGTPSSGNRGEVSRGSAGYGVWSLTSEAFPAGALRATLLIPRAPTWVCANSAAQTVTNTLGLVAQRVYDDERSGAKVANVMRYMQNSPGFVEAVADQDPARIRSEIIGFFRSHLHVVRVRVTAGSRLLVDVGGPHVLAPVPGTLRLGGRVIGHFLVAIQDDTGFLKLVHLFTTAQVLMRAGRQLIGTLASNRALLHLPSSGGFAYKGSNYRVYSFAGRSFPSGPLQISLLLAAS
jgi:hypothetical protein